MLTIKNPKNAEPMANAATASLITTIVGPACKIEFFKSLFSIVTPIITLYRGNPK